MDSHVLVVSRDPMLLETRQLILESFFRVKGACGAKEAEALLTQQSFDLVILCSTLAREDCNHLVGVVQSLVRRPKVLLLNVSHPALAADGLSVDGIEQLWTTESGPYRLLEKSANMLGIELDLRQVARRANSVGSAAGTVLHQRCG